MEVIATLGIGLILAGVFGFLVSEAWAMFTGRYN